MNISKIISGVSGINVKLIAIVIAIATMIGLGSAAVLTYRSAILKSDRLEAENAALISLAIKQKANSQKLVSYQNELLKLNAKYKEKVKTILVERSKRDEEGNITPDDPILRRLNGMFSKD